VFKHYFQSQTAESLRKGITGSTYMLLQVVKICWQPTQFHLW